jgi:hypothetical protein
MPSFYYIQIQGSGIPLCCNLMIKRPHNYVKENVQNLGIKNVTDHLQIYFFMNHAKVAIAWIGIWAFLIKLNPM